ncbi:MAG: (d)CMP kinase [Saprospiraceae bacterium]
MDQKITIAIDGFSSCGKSTLARDLAKELGYAYVDSGAMYRAVTLYFLDQDIDFENKDAVEKALDVIDIKFRHTENGNRTILNGKDVEEEIRTMRVSKNVSPVAAISSVRKAMVAQQQQMGDHKGIVMDGRDIGTVVFPEAELKIFLTASQEVRTQRRFDELKGKGWDTSMDEVKKNLSERDRIDSTREDSPLTQAEDAIVVDNSFLTPDEQLNLVMRYAITKLTELASA